MRQGDLMNPIEPDGDSTPGDQLNGIMVRCYTPIGQVVGFGKIEIEAREVVSLDVRDVRHFVTVRVTSGGQFEQTDAAGIPYDQMPQVFAAIDRLSALNPQLTKFKHIEVEFGLECGFKLIVFNDAKGKLQFSVSVNSATALFPDLLKLADLKSYLRRAMSEIEKNRMIAT